MASASELQAQWCRKAWRKVLKKYNRRPASTIAATLCTIWIAITISAGWISIAGYSPVVRKREHTPRCARNHLSRIDRRPPRLRKRSVRDAAQAKIHPQPEGRAKRTVGAEIGVGFVGIGEEGGIDIGQVLDTARQTPARAGTPFQVDVVVDHRAD